MVNIGVADVAVGEEVILWVLMHWVLFSCFLSYRKLSVVFKNAVAIGAVAVRFAFVFMLPMCLRWEGCSECCCRKCCCFRCCCFRCCSCGCPNFGKSLTPDDFTPGSLTLRCLVLQSWYLMFYIFPTLFFTLVLFRSH